MKPQKPEYLNVFIVYDSFFKCDMYIIVIFSYLKHSVKIIKGSIHEVKHYEGIQIAESIK